MTGWHLRQLTFGSAEARFHAHSYYDIPVMDDAGDRLVGVQTHHTGRHPSPQDRVEVGLVEIDAPGSWRPIGDSTAWSWQQGPMAQWVPGRDAVIWNDRRDGRFIARLHRIGAGETTLPMPAYAIAPDGGFALSLNMARLNTLRPGYGYATERPAPLARVPDDDGVWKMPLDGAAPSLILPLARAVAFLRARLPLRARLRHAVSRYHYWFNHAKIAPGGGRFTVKLRWRKPDGPWNGTMGVSLTCGTDGRDLRLLASATSHVIWLDDSRLYFFAEDSGEMRLCRDGAPRGQRPERIGADLIEGNVHLRHLPPAGGAPTSWVYDTPYRETVALHEASPDLARAEKIAEFTGHTPARGPFRCDLHPCPDARGRRIVVTSMQDGGRQIYVLERTP